MKRDRDLMRVLILELEGWDDPTGKYIKSRFAPYFDDLVFALHGSEARPAWRSRDYQLLQLEKAGLVEFVDQQHGPDFYGGRVRLLPAGHDAAEAIADETLWRRLKKAAPKEAYDIVKSVASASATKALGLAMGWN